MWKMKIRTRYEITHNFAGLAFAIIGTAWWLVPMILVSLGYYHYMPDGTLMQGALHMQHSHEAMHEVNHQGHGPTIMGFTEMTWMWYVMAIVHFFIHDCMKICAGCNKKLND